MNPVNRTEFLVILSLLLWPISVAWGQQGKEQPFVEAAKKEGKVKLGLTVRWEEAGKPAAKKIVELFQSRYPFVKVDYERVGGSRERERVLTELAAGKVPYDVTALSGTQVPIAAKASLAEIVDWRSLGVPARQVHPQGLGVYYRSQIVGILYNRKLVPDQVGSKLTWEDCASAKWKRKIAMDNRPRYLEIFYQPQVWGREKTLGHARQLGANQTIFERSRSAAVTKLTLGEYPIICGANYSHYREQVVYRGITHLGFTLAEPVPVPHGDVVFIPRGADSPNAGKLWVTWSVSEEGQRVLDSVEFDGSPFIPGTEPSRIIKGKKTATYEPQWEAKANELLKEILEAVGLPVVQ
jgi:ABC-type Fe3+ transport system substrate-binding protein